MNSPVSGVHTFKVGDAGPSAVGVAGVLDFFDAAELIVRDALAGSQSSKIAPDVQRALRRIADMLEAAPHARATVEAMAANLRQVLPILDAAAQHEAVSMAAGDMARDIRRTLAAIESAAPVGEEPKCRACGNSRNHGMHSYADSYLAAQDMYHDFVPPAGDGECPAGGGGELPEAEELARDLEALVCVATSGTPRLILSRASALIRRLASTGSAPNLDAMVDRFLAWRLPDDFGPDCGISFTPVTNPAWTHDLWPTGTNLLNAEQARAMFAHCLAGIAPAPSADARDAARWRALFNGRVRYLGSAGLHSDIDPHGRPFNGFAHIGLELWTKHEAESNPEDVQLLTRYADIAAGFITPEQPAAPTQEPSHAD